jgi:ribosomal protein S18 acetylase RimI-like enzyme
MKNDSISPAVSGDIPGLLLLVNSAYRGEDAKQGWTHEAGLIDGTLRTDEDSLNQMLHEPDSTILKYTVEEKICGCVYLQKRGAHVYLGMLSVSPKIQARGIGRKLLEAAEDFAMKNGCIAIEMTVISARSELIMWYERNGYMTTDQRKPFHQNDRFGVPRQHIEFVVMEKKL